MNAEQLDNIMKAIKSFGLGNGSIQFARHMIGNDIWEDNQGELDLNDPIFQLGDDRDYTRVGNVLIANDYPYNYTAYQETAVNFIAENHEDIFGVYGNTVFMFAEYDVLMYDLWQHLIDSQYRVVIFPASSSTALSVDLMGEQCEGQGTRNFRTNIMTDAFSYMNMISDGVHRSKDGLWRKGGDDVVIWPICPISPSQIKSSMIAYERVLESPDNGPETTTHLKEEAQELVDIYKFVSSSSDAIRERIRSDEERVRLLHSDSNDLMRSWTTTMNNIEQVNRQINSMKRSSIGFAAESLLNIKSALDISSESDAVKSVRLSGSQIELVLNPFIMEGEDFSYESWCDDCSDECPDYDCTCGCHNRTFRVKINESIIRIDINGRSPEDCIMVTIDSGLSFQHPHVSRGGRVCLGSAAAMFADALSRRDWHSFIMLIVGWWTQYNKESPYARLDYFPESTEELGWVTDSTQESTTTEQEAVTT